LRGENKGARTGLVLTTIIRILQNNMEERLKGIRYSGGGGRGILSAPYCLFNRGGPLGGKGGQIIGGFFKVIRKTEPCGHE